MKDPRNLHSDCVPVGWAKLCLSLAMLLLAPFPKLASALLRELEGGPVSEFTVAGCHLSLSSTYSSVCTDMFTHTAENLRALFPLCVSRGRASQMRFKWSGLQLRNGDGVYFCVDPSANRKVQCLKVPM